MKIHRKIIEYNYRNSEKDKNKIIPGRREVEQAMRIVEEYSSSSSDVSKEDLLKEEAAATKQETIVVWIIKKVWQLTSVNICVE